MKQLSFELKVMPNVMWYFGRKK